MKRILAVASIAAFAAGCTTVDPNTGQVRRNNTGTGAIAGALAGAALGTLAGGDDRRNAVIGAGIGALAGAGIGNYMDRQQRQLEQQLAGTGVGVNRQGENLVLSMPSDVTFSSGSYQLEPRFYPVLDDIAATLVEYNQTYVDVFGHADSTGDAASNQTLSENRASNVAQYLSTRGVQRERMYVAGMGENQPIADNSTPQGRAQNRRVEIILRPVTA